MRLYRSSTHPFSNSTQPRGLPSLAAAPSQILEGFFNYTEQNGTCFHMLVDEMRLHDGVAPVEGVLAGRVEVVLQQLPPLVPHAQDVAWRRADLGKICRKTISQLWTRFSVTSHLMWAAAAHRNPLQLQWFRSLQQVCHSVSLSA